jgi:uncharacterized membrane protein YdjX (TVP38/TMEM64 family)
VTWIGASARWRFAFFLFFVAITAAIALLGFLDLNVTPDGIRTAVANWGPLAPLAFVVLFALRPFIFFPSTVLFVAGGLAFGSVLGAFYAVIGGTVAGIITFGLARWLGRDFVQARLPARLQRFQSESWGARLVFFMILVPIFPITGVNYAAGLSRISLGGYTLAMVGGLIPRAFAYSFFGDSLLDVGSPQFVFALALLALLVLLPTWLRHRIVRRSSGFRSQEAE